MSGEIHEVLIAHAWVIAIVCLVLCILFTGIQIVKHLKNYTNPHFQVPILIILLMAPFYCFTSSMGIWWPKWSGNPDSNAYIYFNLIRDIYESILIYNFFNLLRAYIGYDEEKKAVDQEKIYQVLATKGIRKHIFPMNYMWKPMKLISEIRAKWFYAECKKGILQFMIVNVFSTFIQLVSQVAGGPGVIDDLCNGAVFISICFALYYLILFYQLLNQELAPYHPLLKFLSVKGVLFFTFWQQVAVQVIFNQVVDFIDEEDDDKTSQTMAIQTLLALLVIVEMVILSLVTAIAFSHKDFKDTVSANTFFKQAGAALIAKRFMKDIIADNFITTMGDMAEFGAGALPTKSFSVKQTEQLAKASFSSDGDMGELDENGNRRETIQEQKAKLFDKITIMPDSLGIGVGNDNNDIHKNTNNNSNYQPMGNNELFNSGGMMTPSTMMTTGMMTAGTTMTGGGMMATANHMYGNGN
jgi:hypothetical protein